ncbi:MAG: hypothetical protein K5872_06580 [Rhizobiaceae bacterium]|nr:hypothetical protein [Rhizobiaceae bacterium]MCV0405878.1 hypothetical protein [Rhizobiaceae bacterium]
MSTVTVKQVRGKPPAKKYEPTPRELRALSAQENRRQQRQPSPRMKVTRKGSVQQIAPDHADNDTAFLLLMESLGTSSVDFASSIIAQLAAIEARNSEVDETTLNHALSFAKGVRPQDEVEGMLAAQMAAVHMATMTFARRLAKVDNIPQQDSAEKAFNKLARTFVAQVEALKRYRSKGEQKVTVEHVTVNEGGRAIVGAVSHGGGTDKDAG